MLTATQPASVLIADDEDISRELLQFHLESLGCRVLATADGNEAVAAYRKTAHWIDLVILDVQMPGLSSIPLYNRLRQIRPGVPIIFCSGVSPDDAEVYRINRLGLPLITKPISRSDMVKAIRWAMRAARRCSQGRSLPTVFPCGRDAMPAPTWSGYLRVSLVTVPLKAYSATSSGPTISLNQLHSTCHSRIRYQKRCPIHGEVPEEEIVHWYEYSKGQYVVVDPDEIQALRTENDKTIAVDAFIPAGSIDPVYLTGSTYYLVPDGPVGQRPYALIRQAMAEEKNAAIGRAVISLSEPGFVRA